MILSCDEVQVVKMKVLFVICLQILVTVSITVPPSWPYNDRVVLRNPSVSTTALPISSEQFQYHSFFPSNAKPSKNVNKLQYRSPSNQQLFVYHPQPTEQIKTHLQTHTPQSYQIVHFNNQNDVPIKQKVKVDNVQLPIRQHLTEVQSRKQEYNNKHEHDRSGEESTAQKEDIRQHLTEVNTPIQTKNNEENEDESVEEIEQNEDIISEHEIPKEVPTKPIYPGEGQWAKYGQKHKPYIRPEPEETKKEIEEEERPEGYDTFEKGEEQFSRARNNHHHNIKTFPEQHQLTPSQIDDSESNSEPLYKKPEIGFIPEKLYTQVRRTETEQHLPRSAIDPEQEENAGRLKEVLKDSRIHTVYTEEGYEDSAYDHAGHEKNAENHEGHAETADDQTGSSGRGHGGGRRKYSGEGGRRHGYNNQRKRIENNERSKNEDYMNSETYKNKNHDVDAAGSATSIIPSKNFKKVTLKNGKNEQIDMDIYTEVKYTPQKKKHKYVKIIPSVIKGSTTEKSVEKPLRRVKRYDKDKLSKKYIRKRPTYYWKKLRTTSTERPLMNSRRHFESAFTTHGKSSNKQNIEELDTEEMITKSTTTVKTTKLTTTSTTEAPSSSNTTTTSTTSTTTKREEFLHPDLLNPELTTRISKPAPPKVLPVKIRKFKVKRQKRYTNDFPKIQVDLKEFTNVETLPDPTEAPDLTFVKYPYYNLPVSEELKKNSPLRYAEDMKNIPKKVENELSFYESREHIVCPEIPSEVNPIPERVHEGEETDKMADTPDLPRLKGLGDKIDCLKVKYFGENPLDSPFFQEEIIEDPVPFFTVRKNENVKKISPDFIITNDKNTIKRELKIKILEPIVVLDEELIESATANPIHQNTEAVLKPPYTLTEMMTMNQEKILKITPKSIYDQITILEQNDEKPSNEKNSLPPTEKFIIIYDNQEAVKNITEIPKPEMKQKPIVSSTVKPRETIRKPQIRKRPMNIVRKLSVKTIKKPQPKTTPKPTTTTSLPSTTTTTEPTTTTTEPTTTELPTTKTVQPSPSTPKPLLIVKTAQKPPQNIIRRPVRPNNNWQTANRKITAFYNIFDISRFLPKVPNHRLVTSEVQYKDFIKPSEQMKVYSDVLQSINNEKENKETSDTKPVAVQVPVPKEMQLNQDSPKTAEQDTETIKTEEVNIQQSSEMIIGMLPPSINAPYKTINNQEDSSPSDIQPQASKNINYYYFIGMRPPNRDKPYTRHFISKRDTSQAEKQLDDTDDLMMEESKFSPRFYQRSKRHLVEPYNNEGEDLLMDETENKPVYSAPPQRKPKVYTEIVRQRPSRPATEEPEEEEEDLNPRKRIYEFKSSKSTTTSLPEIEEIIEEIVTEPPEPTTTPEPRIYPVEANSNNPNLAEYIFFIEKLHDKWAKEDATSTTEATTTTTEKSKMVVTQTVAESVNVRRGEPAYLQIINQLHEVRKEEDDKTTTSTSTTEVPTTETYQAVPVKNSNPFILDNFMSELNSMKAKLDPDNTAEGSNQESSRNRNYSTRFKTNIDTSKYKTIERAPVTVRHNLSSRFNSDDQELPLQKEKTTQTPMIIAIITRPQSTTDTPKSTVIPDSAIEETTNQETEPSTTTTIKPRPRGRPRRPSYTTTTTVRPATSATSNPIFRRRRPSRITTTTQPSTTKSESYFSRRRNRQKIEASPVNHKETFVPVTTETVVVVTPVNTEEPKKQRRFQKVQERHVMSEVTLTRFFEPASDELDDNSEETKKHQYEVIAPLTNTDTLHGGNYKHEHDRKLPKASEEELTTIAETVPFFTDTKLAEDVNQLKESKEASTEKSQASNSLLTQEELAEKVVQNSKVSLYPNMARMVNRLAEMKSDEATTTQDSFEEEETTEKPTFIKDPSRRMYYYAKL